MHGKYESFCYTPIGILVVRCTDTALYSISRADKVPVTTLKNSMTTKVEKQLNEYFSGVRRNFDITLDETQGTSFQKKVWKAVRNIPYGQRCSYGEVAKMAGSPRAARAVGAAMACTPFPIIVPCHRVVSANGQIGGYGAHPEEKEFLLAMEQRMSRQKSGKIYAIFDLDGTLTDPKEGITKSVQYALEDFGIQVPDLDSLTCFIGPPLSESFKEFYGFSEEEAARAVSKYRERYRNQGLFENRVYEGVYAMLTELKKKGKVICLATSKPEVYAKRILRKYGLISYFDIVVGSELSGKRNRKAEVIEEVLQQAGIREQREKAIMIGDRKYDIEGARECGIESIGVHYGYAEKGELEKAEAPYIAESIEELTRLLSVM